MSSLLQHHGGRSPDGRDVELVCYLVAKGPEWEIYNGPDSFHPAWESTTFTVARELIPGTPHPVLYRFYRRPAGMFGPWVVFRFHGREQVPDLSHPIALFRLPRGAERMTDTEARNHWAS
jgi:hypothetical protein